MTPISSAPSDLRAFLRNTLGLFTGNLVAQGITYLTIPILSRLYPPAAFGVFAVFFSLSSLLISVANLRYNNAILVSKDDEGADSLMLLCLFIAAGFSLLAYFAMAASEWWGVGFSDGDLPGGFALLLAASVFLGGVLHPLIFWRLRAQGFRMLVISRMVMSGGTRGINLLWGLVSASPAGLVMGHIGGQVLAIVSLLRRHPRQSLHGVFSRRRLAAIMPAARRYSEFPRYAWANLVEIGNRELPVLLLGMFFSSTVTGIYAMSTRILGQPMYLLGDAISRAYFQKAAELAGRRRELDEMTLTLLRYMTLFMAFPLAVVALLSPDLLALGLGSEWRDAAPYLRALAPLFFAAFIARPLTVLFDTHERQKERSWMGLALLAVTSGSLVLGGVLGRPLLGIALASVLASVINLVGIAWLLELIGLAPLAVLSILGKDLLKALLFAGPALLVQQLAAPGAAASVLAGGIMAVLYGIYVFRTEGELIHLAMTALFQRPGTETGGAG